MNLCGKQKQTHRHRNKLQLPNRRMGYGGQIRTIKQVSNKDLLYSTENYTKDLIITYKGIYSAKKKETLCSTLETNTILFIKIILIIPQLKNELKKER